MRRIIDHFVDPSDHLATDEALLSESDQGNLGDTFRLWEFDRPTVVIGRASKVDVEVDREYCRDNRIGILRRCTGGAAVVGGPGCLMYSVVLGFERHPGIERIDVAHQFVMNRVLAAVHRQLPEAQFQGTCDLTWNDRKFSGNSLRVGRRSLLYHGTILYDGDLGRIADCLGIPPRQPTYRGGRDHRSFITNIQVDVEKLRDHLSEAFEVEEETSVLPMTRIGELKRDRYADPAWHFRH